MALADPESSAPTAAAETTGAVAGATAATAARTALADPDITLRAAKTVADIYGEATADLLAAVARRLSQGIDEPGWAEAKLLELVQLRDEAAAIVDRIAVLGPEAMESAIADAATTAIERGVVEARLTPATNKAAVEALARATVSESATAAADTLGRLGPQILRSVDDVYRSVIAETTGGVVTGSATTRQAAQRALDRFADRGITGFRDAAGRNWELRSYVEMATRTASGRAMVEGRLGVYAESGRNLVIVSDAPQECDKCRPWEGKVLSIDGSGVGEKLEDGVMVAGSVKEATSDGLFHANCRHDLRPYLVGVTKPYTHTEDPDGDKARQEQRRLERGVRQWKQREMVALDDDARRRAAAHRARWQSRLKDHVAEHDLKRQRHRES